MRKLIFLLMVDASVDRLRNVLSQITDSYDKIRGFESKGTSKEELRQELINIRDASDEISPLLGLMVKENLSLGIETLGIIGDLIKTPYLETIKIQIMLLTQSSTLSDNESIKIQANMAVSALNMSGTINQFKFLLALIR